MSIASQSDDRVRYSGVSIDGSSPVRDSELDPEEELGCLSFNPITFSYRPKIDKALVIICFFSSILSLLIASICFESYLFVVKHVDPATGHRITYHYGWMRRVDGIGHAHKSDYLLMLDDQSGLAGFGFGLGHLVYAILLFYGFCHICIYDPQHPSPNFRCLFSFALTFICSFISTVDIIFPIYLFKNLSFHSQTSVTPSWGCFATYLNLAAIWICVVFSCELWLGPDDPRRVSAYEEKYDPSNYGMTKIRVPEGNGLKAKFRRFSESFSSISKISQFVPVHRHGSITHSDKRPIEIIARSARPTTPSSTATTQIDSGPVYGRIRSISGLSDTSGMLKFSREEEDAEKYRLASLSAGIPPTILEDAGDGCFIADWSSEDVAQWLQYMMQLPKYAQNMVDHGIDGHCLWRIDDKKLIAAGVDDGAARSTILSAVLHMRVTPGGLDMKMMQRKREKSEGNVALSSNRSRESQEIDANKVIEEDDEDEDDDSDVSLLENSQGGISPSDSSGNRESAVKPLIDDEEDDDDDLGEEQPLRGNNSDKHDEHVVMLDL